MQIGVQLNLNFYLLKYKFTDCYKRNEIISFDEMWTAHDIIGLLK